MIGLTSGKSAHEVIFSRKKIRDQSHKYLGLTLDSKLNFINKLTAVLQKLQTVLPTHFLLTTYKAFVRPHLDYFM